MKSQKKFADIHLFLAAIALLIFTSAFANPANAQTEGILHSFVGGTADGASPYAGLIADSTGALYGTAAYYGANGQGMVYQLVPPSGGGTWTENAIYSFFGTTDGSVPASNLIMDSTGAIYGTTASAGTFNCGTFYQLVPSGGGAWTENTLYDFPCASGGVESGPQSLVLNQSTGVFYGVLQDGGIYNGGVVFELAPASGGGWTYTALHNFNSNTSAPGYANGCNPWSLIAGPKGDLYGTTIYCGQGAGTVYRLAPPVGTGTIWSLSLLYSFGSTTDSPSGSNPYGLLIGLDGVLYGGAAEGGTAGKGLIYSLTRPSAGTGGPWTETVLHTFAASGDGNFPLSGVILGPAGSLYGTTAGGGSSESTCGFYTGCGTVFQLTPVSGGAWTETLLHEFASTGGDPNNPNPGPLLQRGGNLYGATYNGGAHNQGAVYGVRP
jgi:uncharacterized repeat protein (TIGR03803 family)